MTIRAYYIHLRNSSLLDRFASCIAVHCSTDFAENIINNSHSSLKKTRLESGEIAGRVITRRAGIKALKKPRRTNVSLANVKRPFEERERELSLKSRRVLDI